jgi:hypothetical protein
LAKACLIVHSLSLPYVRRIVLALHAQIQSCFGLDCPLLVADEIDCAEHQEHCRVFVIGESFARFTRRQGCTYVYLNFSVIAVLGSPFGLSLKGWQLIRYKQRLLRDKLDLFDALLDYYPAQTSHLATRLPLPVLPFLPWVASQDAAKAIPFSARPFDICVVGSASKRRRLILTTLERQEICLSPTFGVDIEDCATQSRATLNIHMERSSHFEIPRIIGAMSAGSPVITEESLGIDAVVPREMLYIAKYHDLPRVALKAMNDRVALAERAEQAREWYDDFYLLRAADLFSDSAFRVMTR